MVVCLALVGVTCAMIHNIWAMVKKTPGSTVSGTVNKFGKVAGKLMVLAVTVFVLWLVRVSVATAQEPIITNFNSDAKTWADCQTIKSSSGTWAAQVQFPLPFSCRVLTILLLRQDDWNSSLRC